MKTKKVLLLLICSIYFLASCTSNENKNNEKGDTVNISDSNPTVSLFENTDDKKHIEPGKDEIKKSLNEINLTEYFQGIEGCAVIYDEIKNEYLIHNPKLSEKRVSPCSTFKIVSTLIGLKSKTLEDENTILEWNGMHYPTEEWNQNLTLKQAFQVSCIWYFREVIDKSGEEFIQQTLSALSYGNCDTSQWAGNNVNTGYNELNGFWLESSLLISPREQVDTMLSLFNHNAKMYKDFTPTIKKIMEIDNSLSNTKIYGKTGTGTEKAWFVGFFEKESQPYYYAILLYDSNSDNISGQKAKEITLNIIENYF